VVIGVDGEAAAVASALELAWRRFQTILAELVNELALLRLPVEAAEGVRGPVARRMLAACRAYRPRFITPMAAVAGAVADEIVQVLSEAPGITRAYANNGGDIALHLTPQQSYRVGVFADLGRLGRRAGVALDGDFTVTAEMPVRGVATSGWRGRSFSLGIADSVTVLGACAAQADAAATMIANAVDVEDSAVIRRPASALKDDTDLGDRLVTVEVGALAPARVACALEAGAACAIALLQSNVICGAVLWLQGSVRVVSAGAGLHGA
jgi:ApbE superfamily uncharacterized protein (UPF0280 family)